MLDFRSHPPYTTTTTILPSVIAYVGWGVWGGVLSPFSYLTPLLYWHSFSIPSIMWG